MPRFLLPDTAIQSIDDWMATGVGGRAIEKARDLGPDQTIAEINLSGLRGRGGAGFRTGRKWRTVADASGRHRYVVANGAEGEPATFKDRALMRANPYQLVEGVIVAAFAVGAVEAFICLKASFEREVAAVTRAVQEVTGSGMC